MSIWDHSRQVTAPTGKHACFGPEEKDDINEAKEFCNYLGIPFYVYDCAKEYQNLVLDYFREEYRAGRTPNPCVKCNQQVKLDVLPELMKKSGQTFDKFATGHYAKVEQHPETGRYLLKKARDSAKDQTYFLYRLTQAQLENLLFPLGDYLKDEIREIARKNNLAVHNKTDSQDFYCGDYNDLLNFQETEGNIIHVNGQVLGRHKGIWNYTIGQRKGLNISYTEPLYVIEIDQKGNNVIVGPKKHVYRKKFLVNNLNYVALDGITGPVETQVKIRSSQQEFKAVIAPHDNALIKVTSNERQSAITPGQSAVFYQDDIVLGGGVIEKVL